MRVGIFSFCKCGETPEKRLCHLSETPFINWALINWVIFFFSTKKLLGLRLCQPFWDTPYRMVLCIFDKNGHIWAILRWFDHDRGSLSWYHDICRCLWFSNTRNLTNSYYVVQYSTEWSLATIGLEPKKAELFLTSSGGPVRKWSMNIHDIDLTSHAHHSPRAYLRGSLQEYLVTLTTKPIRTGIGKLYSYSFQKMRSLRTGQI